MSRYKHASRLTLAQYVQDRPKFYYPNGKGLPGSVVGSNYELIAKRHLYELLKWSDKSAILLAQLVTEDGSQEVVAAKIMQNPPDKDKLTNELDILQSLRHEHIAAILGNFSISHPNGTRYGLLVFPLAVEDLQTSLEIISAHNKAHQEATSVWPSHQNAHKLLPYFACLCKTVLFLHKQPRPVKHRDIKPANILIDRVGNVVLADFDISGAYDDVGAAISYGRYDGTRMYSPIDVWSSSVQNNPENGKRGLEWDVVSLGFVFLEMATVLFGRTLEEMRDRMKKRSEYGVLRVMYSDALGEIRKWLNDLGEAPGQFLRLADVNQDDARKVLRAIEEMTSSKQYDDETLERAWKTFRCLSNHC